MIRGILLACLLVLGISIDMSSKYYIENILFGSGKSICLEPMMHSFATTAYCMYDTISLTSWLSIQLSYNTGIAFSLPIRGILLQILTLVLLVLIAYQYISKEYSKKNIGIDIGYVLIFSGALSHAYERIVIGHVVDFIAVKYFAIFNFADIFISV